MPVLLGGCWVHKARRNAQISCQAALNHSAPVRTQPLGVPRDGMNCSAVECFDSGLQLGRRTKRGPTDSTSLFHWGICGSSSKFVSTAPPCRCTLQQDCTVLPLSTVRSTQNWRNGDAGQVVKNIPSFWKLVPTGTMPSRAFREL